MRGSTIKMEFDWTCAKGVGMVIEMGSDRKGY